MARPDPSDGDRFDVVIIGTGIGGSMLGAILARHGVDVLLIDHVSHPRFAIGESTIPETTMLLRLLAVRYGVPEIAHLSKFDSVRTRVSPACGVKRNFSQARRAASRSLPRSSGCFSSSSREYRFMKG